MTDDYSERKACVFCSKELSIGNASDEFNCACGGHYFLVDPGSLATKISCPSCDRHIAIDSGAFNRKIACSCESYFAVIERACSAVVISETDNSEMESFTEQGSEDIQKTHRLGLLEDDELDAEDSGQVIKSSNSEVAKASKTKIKTRKKSSSARRRTAKKSAAPVILLVVLLVLGGGVFFALNQSREPSLTVMDKPRISSDESSPEDQAPKAPETAAFEEKLKSKAAEEGRLEFQYEAPRELDPLELKLLVKSFDHVESSVTEQGLEKDLSTFKSQRSGSAPQYKKASGILSVASYKNTIKPFFEKFCIECHGPEKEKGGMRLDELPAIFNNPGDVQHWQDVLDSLNGAEMPPKKSQQPAVDEMSKIIRSLSGSLTTARVHFASQKGIATVRRLNRREYKNSLRDLLGIEISTEGIPEDNLYNGFDTVGEALTISPFQVRQYFRVAEAAVRTVLANPPKEAPTLKSHKFELEELLADRVNKELKKVQKNIVKQQAIENDMKNMSLKAAVVKYKQSDEKGLKNRLRGAISGGVNSPWNKYVKFPETKHGGLLMPYTNYFSGSLNTFEFNFKDKLAPGEYILRVRSGLKKPTIKAAYLQVNQGDKKSRQLISSIPVFKSLAEGQINELKVRFDESDKDSILEFTVSPEMLVPHEGNKIGKRTDKAYEGLDGIWIDSFEFIGPLEVPMGQLNLPSGDTKEASSAENQALKILEDFAFKAFRGIKPEPAYLTRLMKVFKEEFSKQPSLKKALIRPLSTVLSSGHFLYMIEDGDEKRQWVTDRELAVRLSYFLWSSGPDKELLDLAEKKILHRPNILQAQVNRMIKDERFDGFLEGFVNQWFELDRLIEIAVNQNLYTTYNDAVKLSSIKESQLFINELFQKNLSLVNIIDADFTLINDSMALFYGMEAKGESGYRLAHWQDDEVRGGLLTQSSVLTMTSNGDRTSPVERGAYVLKKFLNLPKMIPPPNVPQLDIDLGKQADTVRGSIAAHSELPQCASCHSLIDPLGFGMENFNTVGQWREQELIPLKKRKMKKVSIDARGNILEKENFDGFVEMRQGLLNHKDKMVKGMIKALLTYGLGRPIGFQDEELVENIYKYNEANNYGAKSLLYAIVSSDAFHLK